MGLAAFVTQFIIRRIIFNAGFISAYEKAKDNSTGIIAIQEQNIMLKS